MKALAKIFFDSGARLILSSRNVNTLNEVKEWLIKESDSFDGLNEPKVLRLDLSSDSNQIQLYAKQALSYYGRIDIIINNGGISYRGRVVDTTLDVDRQLMEVNYFGQLALIKGIISNLIISFIN